MMCAPAILAHPCPCTGARWPLQQSERRPHTPLPHRNLMLLSLAASFAGVVRNPAAAACCHLLPPAIAALLHWCYPACLLQLLLPLLSGCPPPLPSVVAESHTCPVACTSPAADSGASNVAICLNKDDLGSSSAASLPFLRRVEALYAVRWAVPPPCTAVHTHLQHLCGCPIACFATVFSKA